jgi:hypothetical protein
MGHTKKKKIYITKPILTYPNLIHTRQTKLFRFQLHQPWGFSPKHSHYLLHCSLRNVGDDVHNGSVGSGFSGK